MSKPHFDEHELQKFGLLILKIGAHMQSNGASTSRIRITTDRIANAYGFHSELFITNRALTLTLLDDQNEVVFNSVKRTPPMGVNFRLISGISRMSLHIAEKPWTLSGIDEELNRLISLPHYPRIILLIAVSLADAGFCKIADGSVLAMLVAFIATFFGLFVRQEAMKMRFNFYLSIFFAALTATLIAGAFRKWLPDYDLVPGFLTSVLFLIPGVPLINSFSDIIDGNILNGAVRVINGMVISFMIALGMAISILIYNF